MVNTPAKNILSGQKFVSGLILSCTLLLLLILSFPENNRTVEAFASIPPITAYNLSERLLGIKNQDYPFPPEITPLTLMQSNGQRLYVLSTAWSFLCSSSENILNTTPSSPLWLQNCQLITKPDIYDSYDPGNTNAAIKMKYKNPAVINPVTQIIQDWKRTYDGLLSLHLVNDQLIGVRHNEHVNHEYPADWTGEGTAFIYPNTIQNGISINSRYVDRAGGGQVWTTGCRSGFDIPKLAPNGADGTMHYDQCWDSFTNFVSLVQIDTSGGAWTPNTSIRNPELDTRIHDQGPIIWPSLNVRTTYTGIGDWTQWRSAGFYQPTSFVDGGYIYTFFKRMDTLPWCTGAARSPLGSNGNAGSWYFYNRARNAFDIPALPGGFSKESIRNFYDTSTGNISDCIVPDNQGQPQYFNVAKVKGTSYFIATEERSYTDTGWWKMGVRFSTDLVNWSDLQVLSECRTYDPNNPSWSGWGCGKYAYPTFLDKNATTNYEVDPDEFYILGQHATGSSGYETTAMKLSLTQSIPLDTTSLTIHQYYREFLNREASNDDIAWHANYYLQNGCQADMRLFTTGAEFSGIKNSTSVSDYVRILYRAILSREPDSSWWVDQINSGTYNRDTAAEAVLTSPEANYVCAAKILLPVSLPTAIPLPPTYTPIPTSPTNTPPTLTPISSVTPIPPTVTPIPTNTSIPVSPTPNLCPRGDLGNLDCSINSCINTSDWELFRQAFGKLVSELPTIPPDHHTPDLIVDDLNQIDTADYQIFYNNFNSSENMKSCGQ